jgi:hypothetical protein
MKDWIEIEGTLVFDVDNLTTKHKSQSSWKRHVIAFIKDDLSDYYSWFLKRRYNIDLIKPIRGPHFTVVNDRSMDISNWPLIKHKYNNKKIKIYYNVDMRSNTKHWWLKAYSNDAAMIRKELGLGDPYFNPHITIGLVNERNQMASNYAISCEKRYGNFNIVNYKK